MAYGYSVRRIDDNQKQICKAFRDLGWSYEHTHTIGDGFPDGVAGHKKRNYLIEIKDGSKPKSQKKLTPEEEKFHQAWKGQICIIESVEDVVKFVNENK